MAPEARRDRNALCRSWVICDGAFQDPKSRHVGFAPKATVSFRSLEVQRTAKDRRPSFSFTRVGVKTTMGGRIKSAKLKLHSTRKTTRVRRYRGRTMRHALFLVLLIMVAASPAAAQSCATLSGRLDCGAAPAKQPAKAPRPARTGQDAQVHGDAEVTVSNRGVSATVNNTVVGNHGVVEFGFRGSTKTPCRLPGYGSPCE